MDWLTFISTVIGSIAWPAVLVGVIVWLRKPLLRLAGSLRSAKYKDIELEWGQKLEQLEGKADQAKLPEPGDRPAWVYESPDDWTFGDYIERLAPISPRAAISEAWRHVEIALKEAGRRAGNAPPHHFYRLVKSLREQNRLPRDAAALVEDLRVLRNQAVHSDDADIPPERAIEFGRLAERLIASLRFDGPEDEAPKK